MATLELEERRVNKTFVVNACRWRSCSTATAVHGFLPSQSAMAIPRSPFGTKSRRNTKEQIGVSVGGALRKLRRRAPTPALFADTLSTTDAYCASCRLHPTLL